ncbi:FlaG protein [Paenibacillus tianmuensis]|uniref:FlaG protein n=1 Tax=Paenibacillus tianmuensis TaxID=624147 RepID=A0A1G4RR21_9BACL|nr:flagellar protein FlaG [Paenibacillus tianmuensis]SCW58589.1 FlaG protein [Paenibacillus tianmuensis]
MTIQSFNTSQIFHSASLSTISGNFEAESIKHVSHESAKDLMRKEKYELSISEEALVKALERVNKALAGTPSHVEYSIHKSHGDIVVKLINSETKEVIREFPSEKILELLDKLEEINGKIVDEKR